MKIDTAGGSNCFPELLKFLNEQRKIIEYDTSTLRTLEPIKGDSNVINKPVDVNKPWSSSCWVHKTNSHNVSEGKVYLDSGPEERIKLMKENRVCLSCLKTGHRSIECRNHKECSEINCNRFHHEAQNKQGLAFHSRQVNGVDTNNVCLLPLMNILSEHQVPVNLLWDGGATLSLIAFRKAKELQLEGRYCKLITVGGEIRMIDSFSFKLNLRDLKGKFQSFTVYGIGKISSIIQPVNIQGVINLFHGITERDVKRPNGEIDVLIGYGYTNHHPTLEQCNNNLVLLSNRYGKCIGGCHSALNEGTVSSIQSVNYASMGTAIQDFCDVEAMGIKVNPMCGNCRCGKCPIGTNNYSLKEERELKLIEGGLTLFNSEWTARYPWIRDPNELPGKIR